MNRLLPIACGLLAVSAFVGCAEPGESMVPDPLSDEESAAQVVDAARDVGRWAELRGLGGGYRFASCTTSDGPPYQAVLHAGFPLAPGNSVRRLRAVADAMTAHGWRESPAAAEHFGYKLSRDGVVASVYRDTADRRRATLEISGECRNMSDHRNDDPVWTEVTDRLRG